MPQRVIATTAQPPHTHHELGPIWRRCLEDDLAVSIWKRGLALEPNPMRLIITHMSKLMGKVQPSRRTWVTSSPAAVRAHAAAPDQQAGPQTHSSVRSWCGQAHVPGSQINGYLHWSTGTAATAWVVLHSRLPHSQQQRAWWGYGAARCWASKAMLTTTSATCQEVE